MTDKFKIIDDIRCYAPELAYGNDGFDENAFSNLYRLEDKNFWFRSRNNLIVWLVKRFAGDSNQAFLEIGCGTGYVLQGLKSLSAMTLMGSEIYVEGLVYAKQRNTDIEFVQLDARNMPFESSFENIGAFDVLEHIIEDEEVMRNVYNALKPNGRFFITVPQYMFMWSHLDDLAFHKRRYTRSELKRKLSAHGFQCVFVSSFVFTLFPFMMMSRFFKKKQTDASYELDLPAWLNSLFYAVTQFDLWLIKCGLRLPFGGSLVCVAVKPITK